MNYKEEAKKFIKELFFEDWMDENDWEDIEKEMTFNDAWDYDKLASDLEIGVRNGYSIEVQKEITKIFLKKL